MRGLYSKSFFLFFLLAGCSLFLCCSAEPKNRHCLTSSTIGILRYVPTGAFNRDSSTNNISKIEEPFYILEKEITYPQYHEVTKLSIPNNFANDTPVKFVNWYHALIFCNSLSVLEGLTPVYTIGGSSDPEYWLGLVDGNMPTGHSTDTRLSPVSANLNADGYRLPSEMEWVWAAMGARKSSKAYMKQFAGSNKKNKAEDYAWTVYNSLSASHPVGTKLPNELGLYDMSGNVMEWCWDWYGEYSDGEISSREERGQGAPTGIGHVLRGGSWRDDLVSLDFRCGSCPFDQDAYVGFRVVRQTE